MYITDANAPIVAADIISCAAKFHEKGTLRTAATSTAANTNPHKKGRSSAKLNLCRTSTLVLSKNSFLITCVSRQVAAAYKR